MADDEEALFTGTDDVGDAVADGGRVLPNDQPPLDGADTIGLMAFVRDLTYDEVHAFVVGFSPMFTGLLLLPFVPEIAVVMLGLSAFLASAAVVEKHKPTKPLRYIIREVHYYLGGQVSAGILGIVWVGIVALVSHLVGVVV